jgi:hypothetical protein
MSETYYMQRVDVNSRKPVSLLIKEWPYLFEPRGMDGYFQQLMGIELLKQLHKALQSKAARISKAVMDTRTKSVTDVAADINNHLPAR